jgi:hypothetical protein
MTAVTGPLMWHERVFVQRHSRWLGTTLAVAVADTLSPVTWLTARKRTWPRRRATWN